MCTCKNIKEVTHEDINVFNRFSKETLVKLPTEWQINNLQLESSYASVIRFYALQGRLAIEGLATDPERITINQAVSLYSLLEQTDQLLESFGLVTNAAGNSCIGTCSKEKDECKKNCTTKYCGCTWNAFLCKLNCFFSIKPSPEVNL